METKADFGHDCLQLQLSEEINGLALSRQNDSFHHSCIDVTAPPLKRTDERPKIERSSLEFRLDECGNVLFWILLIRQWYITTIA